MDSRLEKTEYVKNNLDELKELVQLKEQGKLRELVQIKNKFKLKKKLDPVSLIIFIEYLI